MVQNTNTKESAAAWSILASGVITTAKFAAAFASGSLAILSDAIHGLVDFAATVMTWFAVRWADAPADEDHHFGHAKIESIAALIVSGILLITGSAIGYESIMRLLSHSTPIELIWWVPLLLIISILVDFHRARVLSHVAKHEASEALHADAAHFASDMMGSIAALVGIAGVWLGFPWADSAAALVVSVMILWIAVSLARNTFTTLLDRAPEGLSESIRTIVKQEPGILHLSQMRLRQAGKTAYVNLEAEVPRSLSSAKLADVKANLLKQIQAAHQEADVSIVFNPVALDSETAHEKAYAIASEHGLAIHHLLVQDLGDKRSVSFDVEMDGAERLENAHAAATTLEEAIRTGLGGNVEVESHMEPKPVDLIRGAEPTTKTIKSVTTALNEATKPEKNMSDVHSIRVRNGPVGLIIHYHCRFPGSTPIDDIHAAMERVETRLSSKLKGVQRVIAHAEPIGLGKHAL